MCWWKNSYLFPSQIARLTSHNWFTQVDCLCMAFYKNGPTPASFLFIFALFKQTIQFFTTNQCEKMSCPSSIRRKDSNPWPLERESPPITTRPGLPPKFNTFFISSTQTEEQKDLDAICFYRFLGRLQDRSISEKKKQFLAKQRRKQS